MKKSFERWRPGGKARLAAGGLALALLAGCASFSADGGFGPVQQTAKDRLDKDVVWAREPAQTEAIEQRVAELLKQPLSADNAVQVALLNNKGLQASFFELGIAEADLVQAGRLPNPGFGFGRLTQGSGVEIDRSISFSLARLLTLPTVQRIESRHFERTRGEVALQVLSLAAEARKAWIETVAADESARYMHQVMEAAEAGAELARRQAEVGNWNRLQQAREQAFYADAALGVARAEATRVATRERLTRLLGLWGAQAQFTLPQRLPDLPKTANDLPDVEQRAMAQRLDVQAARLAAAQLAENLGLTKTTRFVNVLEIGAVRNSFSDAPVERGYEVSVELPLFDWGGARVAKAESIYMQAVNATAQTAVEARSQVREAYAGYRNAFDIARHYRDEIVPLKKRISEENQLRYNGMLIGIFELLADARSQITSVVGSIEALRDFWLAQANLDMAMVGRPSPNAPLASPATEEPTALH